MRDVPPSLLVVPVGQQGVMAKVPLQLLWLELLVEIYSASLQGLGRAARASFRQQTASLLMRSLIMPISSTASAGWCLWQTVGPTQMAGASHDARQLDSSCLPKLKRACLRVCMFVGSWCFGERHPIAGILAPDVCHWHAANSSSHIRHILP